MIGVAKNHKRSTFARMSRMSRKWTASAATKSARAVVKTSWTSTATGNHAKCHSVGGLKMIRNRIRIGRPRKKCTMFASTLTIGSTSAGNITFLIRLPPEMSEPDASVSDAENQVHGRMPQNMKSAYGCTPAIVLGSTVVKTNQYTSRSSSGLTNDQKKPRTD